MSLPSIEIFNEVIGLLSREGADYSEIRYHRREGLELIVRNGKLITAGKLFSEGVGIRVLKGTGLGFSSTPRLSREDIKSAALRALAYARTTSSKNLGTAGFSREEKLGYARVKVPMRKGFDYMSVDEKLKFFKELWDEANNALKEAKLSALTIEYVEFIEEKEVLTSDGGWIYSSTPRILLHILFTLSHAGKGVMQRRIMLGESAGLEALEEWKVTELLLEEIKNVERVLLKGVEPPKDPVPIILGSEVVGLIVHESAGHPMEADRILGREAAQAGKSFIKPEMIGAVRIGNEYATVIDDPTIPKSFGFYIYDDEAVPARPRYIYLKGLINEPLHNRWSAAIFHVHSNASARAMDYSSEPIIRMANTYLEPGDMKFEELLEEAKNGVYIRSYMEWNIDDIRWGQRYVGLEAYMIRNGELAEPVRNPVIEFTTKDFYSNIMGKSRDLRFYAGICGKGEPMQGIPVWMGGPDVLLKPLKLNVAPS